MGGVLIVDFVKICFPLKIAKMLIFSRAILDQFDPGVLARRGVLLLIARYRKENPRLSTDPDRYSIMFPLRMLKITTDVAISGKNPDKLKFASSVSSAPEGGVGRRL